MAYNLIDFIILFILSFLFTQAHQFFPASTFPTSLFPLLFISLLVYLWLSIEIRWSVKIQKNKLEKFKVLVFSFIVLITLARTFYSAIHLRYKLGPSYPVHDNPIQIEEAVKYLLSGKNPYTKSYFGTAMQNWHGWEGNPALYHFATLPFYIVFSLIVSIPSQFIFGYFDQRMVHLLAFLIVISLLWKLIKPLSKKIFYLSLFIFNPLFIHFFIEGRNDIFVFSWLFLSLYLLKKRSFQWSALFLGLAFSSKQSSWLILPFYFFYVFWQPKKGNWQRKFVLSLKKIWPFFLTVLIFFLPFLIWDAKSFIEDIYHYPSGNIKTSYPIKGVGFSEWLYSRGYIASNTDYYPFWIWQLVFGIPLLIFLLYKLKRVNKLSFLVFSYGIFLFVFWLFSRFFVDNYVGHLSMIFLSGLVFLEKERVRAKTKT